MRPYPPTWEQSVLAAVLAGPPGTVASHRSAARLHGLRGCRSDLVEITCRRWRRAQRPFVVHESLAHDGRDTVVVGGIPATDISRTIVDLGAVMYPDALGRALDEARRRGQVNLRAVERRLEERAARGRNGIVVVRELIDERQGRLLTSTGFEDLLLQVIERHGLPRPELQWPVVDRGFTAFLDFAYPSSLVAIEADSEEYHLDLETFHGDRARQNRVSLMGWTFLRYTGRHLRNEPQTVARQIATALGIDF